MTGSKVLEDSRLPYPPSYCHLDLALASAPELPNCCLQTARQVDQLRSQNHELQHELQKALQRHQQATEAANAAHRLAVGELRREAGELGAALELGRLNVKNGLTIAEGLAGAPRGARGHQAAGSCMRDHASGRGRVFTLSKCATMGLRLQQHSILPTLNHQGIGVALLWGRQVGLVW